MSDIICNAPTKVLLADDDTLMHDLVTHALSDSGFTVIAVADGQQAVGSFMTQRPDLVLLDVNMPVLDGYSTCEEMRRLDPNSNVPIIMITGLDDIGSIEKAYGCGAADFITKPITWPTLSHRLSYLHRGNVAALEVQAKIRHENALYNAIPDSVMFFNADYSLKRTHQGTQGYLFIDQSPDNQGAVLCMLLDHFSVAPAVNVGDCFSDFTRQLDLDNQHYFLECRQALIGDDGFIVIIRDISQQKANEEKILNLVLYDPLTGLPNRKYLEEQLTSDINNYQSKSIALLLLNLRSFAQINDNFGLAVGDDLIVAIGHRVAHTLRLFDLTLRANKLENLELSRFAGDEFAVILRGISGSQDVLMICQCLNEAIELPFVVQGIEIYVSFYMGCSFFPDNASNATELIATADSAMHLNKQDPKLEIAFYDVNINEMAKRKHLIESKLRNAQSNQEFFLMIQPKIHLNDPTKLSGELLIRWDNPELGRVSPAEFIPIAESSGIIFSLSSWVFEQACRIANQFKAQYQLEVKLAVNISPQMFLMKESFPEHLQQILNRYNQLASNFELEITEYVLMNQAHNTVRCFKQLQQMGFKIALDDFGTGYSSLSYLTQFDLDTLKIDRAFVSTLESVRSQKLVKSLLAMAQQLDMTVVAEGVENQTELSFLKEHNCDYVQGFLLAKPMQISQYVDYAHKQSPRLVKPSN